MIEVLSRHLYGRSAEHHAAPQPDLYSLLSEVLKVYITALFAINLKSMKWDTLWRILLRH